MQTNRPVRGGKRFSLDRLSAHRYNKSGDVCDAPTDTAGKGPLPLPTLQEKRCALGNVGGHLLRQDNARCNAGTLMKLSSTLGIPMEQLITLTVEKPQCMEEGRPTGSIWKKICPPVWTKCFVSTFRAKKTRCLIWTVCGENCIARSTQISGAMPLRRSRQTIFVKNIYKGGENL